MYIVRQKILTINLALILLFILACEEKKQPQEYVAKVGNATLTEEVLESYLSQDKYAKKFKNEFIRQWIEEELLYREANEEEFTKTEKYLNLLETAQKQIANSLLLENYFKTNFSEPSDNQLSSFYETIKESFSLSDDAYVLNSFEFDNEENALEFRNLAVQYSWNDAAANFENDSSLVSKSEGIFCYSYILSPLEFSRSVKELNPGEVSLVIQKEPAIFAVVQVVKIVNKDTIPDYDLVKKEVKEIYHFKKQKELFSEYLNKLYSKYNVELKKVDE